VIGIDVESIRPITRLNPALAVTRHLAKEPRVLVLPFTERKPPCHDGARGLPWYASPVAVPLQRRTGAPTRIEGDGLDLVIRGGRQRAKRDRAIRDQPDEDALRSQYMEVNIRIQITGAPMDHRDGARPSQIHGRQVQFALRLPA
jgi:hypothetical protein